MEHRAIHGFTATFVQLRCARLLRLAAIAKIVPFDEQLIRSLLKAIRPEVLVGELDGIKPVWLMVFVDESVTLHRNVSLMKRAACSTAD